MFAPFWGIAGQGAEVCQHPAVQGLNGFQLLLAEPIVELPVHILKDLVAAHHSVPTLFSNQDPLAPAVGIVGQFIEVTQLLQ